MGMFDYVKCEVPLPDGWDAVEHPFQTKDFEDPYLETYVIRHDGRLIRHKPAYDIDPPGTVKTEIDMNFHGFLRFYSYEGDPNDETPLERRWHEYSAKFTDGQLVEISSITDGASNSHAD